jgi:hypothetical protein
MIQKNHKMLSGKALAAEEPMDMDLFAELMLYEQKSRKNTQKKSQGSPDT